MFYPYKKASLCYPSTGDLLLNIDKVTGKRGLCYSSDYAGRIKRKIKIYK